MVSSKNLKYKVQQDAQRVSHYGLRKLSVGVASVLLGTVVYMQNSSTVHADVNPTVSAGNDSVKIADKNVGVGYSTGAASGINSTDSANSVVAAGGATDSTASSHSAASPVQRSTGQGNNAAAAVGESESGASAGQAKPGVNQVVASDNIEAVAGSVIGPNRPASVAAGNSSRGHLFANLSVKPSFLAVSKVASTGTFNDAVNGGFDQSTWGKLDVNAWQGHVQGDYYQLTDYTGDANHVIVPNEADFAKAGISTSGKQVGVTSDLMHRIFRDKTTAQDATVAFSKTDNKQIKAINADWENTWGHRFRYDSKGKLSKFDGTNLDVSNVTNMSDMFSSNQINDLSSLAYWKVDNVTNMGDMFEINQINNISPLANWKTANVTDMNGMFGWNKITDLSPLTNWKVDKVTNMGKMFESNQISDLSPLTNWKVDNVTNMGEMFESNQISDLSPLANWKTDNVTNMSDMFEDNQISNLSPLANWKVDNVTNMHGMFGSNQISDLSPLANWKVDNVTNMNDMFGWNKITDLSFLANWKVGKVIDMGYMFIWNKITDLSPLASWKVDKVTNMGEMFESNQISDLSPLTNWKVDKVTNMDEMFESNQISDLSPLTNWKVDNVTNMGEMFESNHISDLSPLANWKVDNVTNMHGMFEINRISDLSPLANWKVDNVTNMHGMFEINRISDLSPLANWKVNNVTDMSRMFDDNVTTRTKNLQAKRVINFAYPDGYTGKKQDPVTQTVDVPQKVSVALTTKDSKPSNNILDWVIKTETPETPALVYFQDYTVPEIKGLLEPDQTVIAGQKADITKPINVTVTYKLLESNTNDAFALDSKNGLHEHANVNDNGGYDTDFWGTLDVSKFTTVKNGDNLEITGYTGDTVKVIIPNIADFELNSLDQGAKQVIISSRVMHQLAKNATRIGLSKTNNQKVVASDANWSDAFGGLTNEPNTSSNANGGMWVYNSNLTAMDLHNLDTTNITNMSAMFNGGRNLNVVGDLSQWNVANVVDMRNMFQSASSLTNIGGLDNWNTSKVTNMTNMFGYATSLTNIGDLSKWNTSNVTNMHNMFANATDLTNIGNLDNWNTSKVTNMGWMFGTDPGKQSHLINIGDLSKWQTGNVIDMNNMFANATDLTNIGNLDNWNTSKVIDMSWMFSGDSDKQSHLTNVGDLSKWDTSRVTNMMGMFANATNLTNIGDLSKWQTGNVIDMSTMFANATNLTNVGDLSKWNTSKVTNMSQMFSCDSDKQSHLTNIGDLSNWDTSKVTDMSYMFAGAANLTNIGDLSKWQTGNVIDMSTMFANATNLTNVGDLSKWQTGNVTDMSYMFTNAINLTNIGDLSKWNTSKVTNMLEMFGTTNALRHLNISNWDLTKLANKDAMKYMFANDTNLTVIANDLKLPTWYQNEINDADYFWNNHMAVITNVPELIRATGDIDNLKIDDQNASRSIFYDSKGSDDAIAVLKQANQAYVKQYQNEHPGYTLNLAADVDQTDPIALANARFISVPREVQFTIAYYDLTGKLVDATTIMHKVGETVSVSPVAPANYVLANGQLRMNYSMHWGSNEVDFLVAPKVTTTTQTKSVSRTITVQTPDGQTNNVVQTVIFVRNGYLNQVTKQTTYSAWSYGGQYQFSGYQPKPMDGYTADVAPSLVVMPDSSNTMLSLAYHKLAADYSVSYQLANGTAVKNVSVTPDSDGRIQLVAPAGYRLLTPVTDVQVGHGSQNLTVLVVPATRTYTAKDNLPETVTEPLKKAVTRKVIIAMPNGRTRTVTQTVHFTRTVTVDSAGQVTYGDWQVIGRAQFNQVFAPKRHGYHLVITNASGKALSGVDKIDHVTAAMSDEVVNVKYVKD